MKVGDIIAGRFVVTDVPFKSWHVAATDQETGDDVRIVIADPRRWLDALALESLPEVLAELDEPRILSPLCWKPLVFSAGRCATLASAAQCADATLELLTLCHRARVHGIPIAISEASVDDAGQVRLPAPSTRPNIGLQVEAERWDVLALQDWFGARLLDRREDARWLERVWPASIGELGALLADRSTAPVEWRATLASLPPWPPPRAPRVDWDLAIKRGEAAHREALGEPERYAGQWAYRRRETAWPLAALHHHRACARLAAGDRSGAIGGGERAVELDPHTRYLSLARLDRGRRAQQRPARSRRRGDRTTLPTAVGRR